MDILKNLRNILPIPKKWKDDELHFGMRINNAIVELFARNDKCLKKDQGASNAGKLLGVDSTGSIAPVDITAESVSGFTTGINIEAGTDLNDLTTPGVYCCANATVAGSCTNCPNAGGFSLIVSYANIGSSLTQILCGHNGVMFIRSKTSTGFGSWYYIPRNTNFAYLLSVNTTTASRAVSKGEIIFYNNGIHIATDDIAQGESSFTSKLTQITGGVLNYLNSKNKTSTITFDSTLTGDTSGTRFYSQGNMRVLYFAFRVKGASNNIPARTTTTIATVDSDSTPSEGYMNVCFRYQSSGQVVSDSRISVSTAGTIRICCDVAITSDWFFRGELIWFVE